MRLPRKFPSLGVEVRKSDIHGLGVFALKRFRKGRKVAVFSGYVKKDREKPTRHSLVLKDGRGNLWTLEPDAPFRFVNHSKHPNIFIPGNMGPISQAIRNIQPGAEITIHYGERWRGVN